MFNPFFSNRGPFDISEILKLLKTNLKIDKKQNVVDIMDLLSAKNGCITFYHSKKYNEVAKKTKASYCITTQNLKDHLPNNCIPIIVDNVLVATSIITQKFYPNSIEDEYDKSAIDINNTQLIKSCLMDLFQNTINIYIDYDNYDFSTRKQQNSQQAI